MLWGLDPVSRFLLKGMKHPYLISNLNGEHDSKCISTPGMRYLENSGAESSEWFRNIRLASFRGDCQSRKANRLRRLRKSLEILARSLDPGDGSRFSGH